MKTKSRSILTHSIATMVATFAFDSAARAQSSTWTTVGGGSWNTATNWAGGVIAAGADNTADFSTVNITATATVNLDGSRTIGGLRFEDDTTASNDWVLATGTAGSILTLNVTTGQPLIEVLNRTATISAVLTGNDGLMKSGLGTLVLSGANTLSGDLTINGGAGAGVFRASNANALGSMNNITVNTGTTAGGQGTTFDLTGTITIGSGKTITLNSGAGDLRTTFLNSANNNTWAGNVVAAGPGLVQVNAAANTTLTISGPVSSTEAGTLFTRGAGTVNYTNTVSIGPRIFNHTDSGTVIVSGASNSWAQTQASDGVIQLGASNVLPDVDFTLGQASGTNGRFELNGFDDTIAGLRTFATSTGPAHVIRNSNLANASTLTFSTAAATTDVLKNTHLQHIGDLTLVKTGSGRFELQDVRADNTAIQVNDGTLAFVGGADRDVRAAITAAAAATIDKAGAGTVSLVGGFTNAGPTTITAGRLAFGSGTAGTIAVADGASLGAGANGGTLAASAVTLGSTTGASFAPQLTTAAAPVMLAVTTLTTQGTTTPVTPEGAVIAPGTYRLIQYGGTIGGAGYNFALGAAGTFPHMTASVVNNTAANRIDLQVTAVDSLIWTGATNGTWDVNSTPNFKLASSNTPATFFQSDSVLFDDTGANKTIAASAGIRIGNLVFNNSTGNDYTVTGVLSGPGGVTKTNSGTTTLASANTFSGGINVAGGTLVLGGANTSHGAVNISAGTLRLGNTDAISSGAAVTISGAGTLDVAGLAPNVKIPELHVSGAGVGGNGAVVNTGANITNNNHALEITLDGDTSWGGTGRYDLAALLFNGGNFTFTKVGTNETWYSANVGSTLGPVVVNGGLFGIQGLNGINTSDSVTVNAGARVGFFSAITVTRPIILVGGGIQATGGGTPTVAGQVTLQTPDAGGIPVQALRASGTNVVNISGKLTGPGGFEKSDTGTVQIQSAANDYAGNTLVSAGTLNFNAAGVLPATTNLTVTGGTFDPSNKTITVASVSGTGGVIGQATAGTGVIVTNQAGATSFTGSLNRALLRMNGTGTLTLGGTADNVTGTAEVNAGTLILGKTGDDNIHSVGAGGVGLTINNGGLVQIAGSTTGGGTGSNVRPADAPANYADQIFNLTDVVVNSGGVLDLNDHSEVLDALTGNGTIRNSGTGTTRLYTNNGSTSSTFGGVIENGAGTMELTKMGTGTLTLTGANTYTGATNLLGGGLQVNGSLASSAITVPAGTTLSGNGTVAGAVTLSGTLASSNSVGSIVANNGATINVAGANNSTAATLTTGSLTLGAGATRSVSFDFDGTSMDRINATGTDGMTLDGTNNVTILFPNGGGWKTGAYPIFGYAGTLQGTGISSLALQNAVGHNAVVFVDSPGAKTVSLQVAAVDLLWTGNTNATWDTTTANWALSSAPATPVTFLNGDNVVFNDGAAPKAVTVSGTVTPTSVIFNDSTSNYTLSGTGAIAGAATTVTKRGTGTTTLTNPNTYTGRTLVEAGTLVLNYSSATPVAAGSELNVSPAATLRLIHNDADFTVANALTGAGTVVLDPHASAAAASRSVTLSGNNSGFTGTLRLSPTSGTFRATIDNVNDLGGATVDVDSGGQIFVSANSLTFPNNFTISGTGFTETAGNLGAIRAANPTTFNGNITVDGTAKIGALAGVANLNGTVSGGTLTVGGNANTNANESFVFTGDASGLTGLVVNDVSTNAGTITATFGNGTATGNVGTVPIQLNTNAKGAVLRFNQGNDYVLNAPVTSAGNTTFQADTLAGATNGKGLVLTSSVNLNGGAFQVGSPAIANNAIAQLTIETGGSISANTVFLGEQANKQAAVDQTGGSVNVATQMRIGHWPTETSTYTMSGGDLSVTPAAGGTFPFGSSEQDGGIYLGIDGTGVLNQTGGAISTNWIVLDNRGNTGPGANMTTGVDTYSLSGNGILTIRSAFGIISRNATAAVELGGGTVRAGASFNLDSDKITVTGNTTIDTNGNVVTVLGPLGGSGGLTVTGGGTLRTADSAAIGGGSLGTNPVSVSAGGTLRADRTGSDQWGGAVSGAGALVKDNTGLLILTANNTYTGTTTINGGTLQVDGSLGATAVTVAAGAQLSGTGIIGGAVSINGTVAPGASPGTLTLTSAADFNPGSTFALEIDGASAFDQLTANGVTLDGPVNLTIDLGYSPAFNTTFTVLNNTSASPIGGTAGQFTSSGPEGSLTEGEHFFVGGQEFTISYQGGTGNDVVLRAVPEPTAFMSMLGGAGALLGLQRFRRKVTARRG
jgi:autotransporter-associated beta strand protein